ncbi:MULTISPECIES: hypothetical protein [Xanthomonas]|uniref:Uncharacterized protein n=2 Tax=Xanthomonas TaxID=338 RepID=A0ABM8R2E6_9XANT|nr:MULTISPECIES: hypothetical protein [Xanthomonas]MBV6799793.1 hypothetical protein [Xanthomonas campestris pv. obscurae]MCW1981611.1 hypothetical protein [Xanthomonas campestris]MEB2187694.1 hypothetical protein [Xanthomonas campestris pv. campestris]MBB4722728.1 hypothetical protein [Xanthomonas euvesicatoria]MBB4869321.1 hypothetical protein [Xanthomonas euvesicatoria]
MHLQPKAQAALKAAYGAQGRTLRRTRGGFAAMPAQVQTSGPVQIQAFTRRCINWLDEAGLVQFDDPQFPNVITLNPRGIAYAEQLLRDEPAARGKAGAQ